MPSALSKPLIVRAVRLAFPVAGAYFVIMLGLAAESMIVGRELGAKALAALGLAASFSLVLVLAFHALEIAAQAIVSRRFGEGNLKDAGACFNNAVLLAFGIGAPLTGVLYFIAPYLFSSAKDPEIMQLAVTYFNYRLPSIPFVIAILVMIGFFNAISKPVIPMILYGIILALNAGLCFGLVGGRFGLPAMGIGGAGVAQTISSIVGFVCFLGVMSLRHYRSTYGLFHFGSTLSKQLSGAVLKLAGPVFVQQFFTNFGMFLFSVINARVPDGGVSLSAATIARQIAYATYLPSLGFGIAAATMVGQYLGARKQNEAVAAGYVCWFLGAVIMCIGGACFVVFHEPLIKLFIEQKQAVTAVGTGADNHARVVEMTALLLMIIAAYQPLEAVNTILGKALQGAGDTFFVMAASLAGLWGVFLPLAYLLAIPMHYGAVGAMVAFAIQLVLISIAYFFRYRSSGWRQREL